MQGVDYNTLKVTLGSRAFMAPELITNEEPHDMAVDVWALGVTAFYLLTYGKFPFPGNTKIIVDDKIKTKEPELYMLEQLESPAATEFIRKCLIKDRNARPSAAELLEDEYLRPAGRPTSLILSRMSSFMRTADALDNFYSMGEF